ETLRRIRQMDSKLLVILMTAYGTTQTAIEAMKLGAYDYLLKPFDVVKLKDIVNNALKAAHDMRQVVSYQPLLESEDYEIGIVGRSEAMQQVFKMIGQVAGTDATAPIKVDVRIIAATNKPLEEAVAARQFREDLFYRLNVVRIHIPPLRERREDVRLLVNYFLKKFARDQEGAPKSISTGVIKALEQ